MTKEHDKNAGSDRLAQAARLRVRVRQAELHGPEISKEELKQAERFFNDSANQESIRLVRRVSDHVDRWRSQGLIIADRESDSPPDGDAMQPPYPDVLPRRRVANWGWACAIALVGIAVTFALYHRDARKLALSTPIQMAAEAFQAPAGRNEQVTLPDGTHVTLGAQTEITYRFINGRRLVHLLRGEALFQVAHDPTHPFSVEAGRGTVTALGTEFNVRQRLDRVTVTVTEGSVFVEPETQGLDNTKPPPAPAVKWQPLRLEKGQSVTYDEAHDRGRVEAADESATEWRQGMFDYLDVPLKYVVVDLNRYRAVPIEFADPAAGEYEFSGTIFLDRTDQWLRSLENILPLEVRDDSGTRGRVLIGSRQDSDPPPSH